VIGIDGSLDILDYSSIINDSNDYHQNRRTKMYERQIVDTKTGEVKSRGMLGENSNFIMVFRSGMDGVTELA